MAIEDEKYDALIKAIQVFMGTGRNAFVRSQLVKLAYSILRHYGYDVIESPPAGEPNIPPAG